MHDTARSLAGEFFRIYGRDASGTVLVIGSGEAPDGNGAPATALAIEVGVSDGARPSLDGDALRFEDEHFDIVAAPGLQRYPNFWLLFIEMLRVTRAGGLIYVDASSDAGYDPAPFDGWRFYPDAPLALMAWAERRGIEVALVESFTAPRADGAHGDSVMVFRKGPADAGALPDERLADAVPAARTIRSHRSADIVNVETTGRSLRLLAEKDRQISLLRGELELAEQKLERKTAALEDFSEGRAALEAALRDLRRDFSATATALQDAVGRFEYLRRDPYWGTPGSGGSREEVQSLQRAHAELEAEGLRRQIALRQVQRQLSGIRTSPTWRIGAPFREIERLVRATRHRLRHGWGPHAAQAQVAPLFDAAYYRAQNPDIASTIARNERDALVHFCRAGWREGRDPNPLFNVKWYLETNGDVVATGLNPVIHYATSGWREGRDPGPAFSVSYYLRSNPDVLDTGLEPLQHYLERGRAEGRRPHPAGTAPAATSPVEAAEPVPVTAEAPDETPPDEAPPASGDAAPALPAAAAADGGLRRIMDRAGLFEPEVYLDLHPDVRADGEDAWDHFVRFGMAEGRRFATTEVAARALSRLAPEVDASLHAVAERLSLPDPAAAVETAASGLREVGGTVAIYCSTQGNFFMQEIANLLAWQLSALGIEVQRRTERSPFDEEFAVRIFVAPHEFFWFERGTQWRPLISRPGTVLYNVERPYTSKFCRAFSNLLAAPLVLDINLQSAVLLQQCGINAVYYAPPYLEGSRYGVPQLDVSQVEVLRGYRFARAPFDFSAHESLGERPIDLLFVGTGFDRRANAFEQLRRLTDKYRFLCVSPRAGAPLTASNYRTTSPEINCALGQRSKIVLNIHRDWLGPFAWSRMVKQGFWQGACVVSDPGLADPIFRPGEHFLEENLRQLPDLIDWLLGTPEGHARMDSIAAAGHRQAISPAARAAILPPLLDALTSMAKKGRAACRHST
ncbi:hypothetical protein [Ancylobacter amanitiformis]|uniref:Uncharacterized protein n=1 Tax=Ancylobacter amanitiformis TaxID=217069 RepID=A0ABU0LTZ1_9HYPH|nr:hypothetical protein [Ancylobacter amanitiformis]MDQ0512170.1 hypothetical protein [Ancylobacter amanitiformis]